MVSERISVLLTKKLSGELTLPERIELTDLVNQDEQNRAIADLFEDLFQLTSEFNDEDMKPVAASTALKIWEKIEKEKLAPPRKFSGLGLKKMLQVAAAMIIVAGGLSLLYFNLKVPAGKPHESSISTSSSSKSSKTNIVLPDGTKVWINANTKLTYNENFGIKLREVYLTGEAFFDVVRNETVPFIVHINTSDIKVLGTAFNVRAYPRESSSQTTLIRGSVEVTLKEQKAEKIIMKPLQKLTLENKDAASEKPETVNESRSSALSLENLGQVKNDAEIAETNWIQNKLSFENESIDEISKAIEQFYNVKVVIENQAIKKRRFTGTFKDDSLPDVLESIKQSAGVHYEIKKDIVRIF